jgi:hypothetical protein
MFKPELYPHLSTSKTSQEIRILDLEPVPDDLLESSLGVLSPLSGTLRVVSLKDLPKYTALSYVWGTSNPEAWKTGIRTPTDFYSLKNGDINDSPAIDPLLFLHCHKSTIRLSRNCSQALRLLRKHLGSLSIWVDSICINQGAIQERNHQVQLMRKIYSQAEVVYVWLGNAPSQIASGGLGALQRLVHDDSDCSRGYNKDTLGLDHIFRNQWFCRGWTLQELVLASEPVFFSEVQTLPWNEVQMSVDRLGSIETYHQYQHQLVDLVDLWKSFNGASLVHQETSIENLILKSLMKRTVSEPKDRAYAAYGILQMLGVQLTEPDYGKSTETVLRMFFLDMLR